MLRETAGRQGIGSSASGDAVWLTAPAGRYGKEALDAALELFGDMHSRYVSFPMRQSVNREPLDMNSLNIEQVMAYRDHTKTAVAVKQKADDKSKHQVITYCTTERVWWPNEGC